MQEKCYVITEHSGTLENDPAAVMHTWNLICEAVDIIDEVILGTDVMNAYGFVVDLRDNVLRVGQEKIKLRMAKMTGSAYHSIEQVTLAKEEVNKRCV